MDVQTGVRERDEQCCIELWLSALQGRDGEVDENRVRDRARAKFERPIIRFAVLGPEPIGFALTVETTERVAVLELLAVSPDTVGRGCGTALLVDAVNSTQLAGYQQIELQVRAGNSRAIGLYRSIGFERTGRVHEHPLGGDAMVTFARALT
ncbi:GNAT family N-acetyltransferase [Rhodococcus sp. IEGM 1409]|uniref:GNAT family N-acetyltransferase n=1 Tax=Rhodococcus sp. IEGM 1409 TaxID=3047082 RepID=UPI0024B81DC1|nr:GNAT family N-acetyltransferase [Rhodococcus sp. IEGM 1409]MDI9903669.1 GNAT family N-acetyltransferase [Rhodococcus sp. IEGM 1409]